MNMLSNIKYMKIFIPKINESWIVDRFRSEWYENNKNISTTSILKADIIWIMAPWMWKKIPKFFLKRKIVLCTYHHFVESKFSKLDFDDLDQYVNSYHAISKYTEMQLRELTNKNIFTQPFWVNQKIWFPIENKEAIRKDFDFSKDDYLVGSFQRDTESADFKSPKLEKGPDIFFKIVSEINKDKKNLLVVLTGKNRQYLIEKFTQHHIRYKYFEMIDQKKMNQLYNILNLYIVSSRVEGGPQSILECSAVNTPIISTDVGVANKILHTDSIYSDDYKLAKPNIQYANKSVQKYFLPEGLQEYRLLFENLK